MGDIVTILLISGSLRAGSTNTALVRTAHALGVEGVNTTWFDALDQLPHFNPDRDVDPGPAPVAHLRHAIGAADAVLFCTPEYAGSLPGSFKNLLDWSVGGGEMYEKPVGWVNVSGAPTGARGAHDTLAVVLGYVGALVMPTACVDVPVARSDVGPDGLIRSEEVRQGIVAVLHALQCAVLQT